METHIRKSGGSGNGRRKPAGTAIRGREKSAAKQPLRSGVLFHRTGTAGKDSIDTQMSDKTGMLLRERLLRMSHPAEVRKIAADAGTPDVVQELYGLLFDEETKLVYRAAWVLSRLAATQIAPLGRNYDRLISAAVRTPHAGCRRMLLHLLHRLPQPAIPAVDLLDFCLERMTDPKEPHGVRMLCIKIAYGICRTDPDLRQEFGILLDQLEQEPLPPSLSAACRNIRTARGNRRPPSWR